MNNRIFISSTCFDLIDLRAELKLFIEQVGLKPIMSDNHNTEFETYQDKNSIETCLVNLRSCDTVIIILSQRYGGNLLKAGFGDYSATHLEYEEAVKGNKRILFFVRDRLEADYCHYKKTKDANGLSWIAEKDIKIFDILTNRKSLAPKDSDNWIWFFNNVLDIKERLMFDLNPEIKSIRLDKLIESGNIPLITVSAKASVVENSSDIKLDFTLDNVGNQTAVEPIFLLFKAETYKQVLKERHHKVIGGYNLERIRPLKPNDSEIVESQSVMVSEDEYRKNVTTFVVEVIYKTIYGDLIADATEIIIRLILRPNLDVITRYTSKRYINDKTYEKIFTEEL